MFANLRNIVLAGVVSLVASTAAFAGNFGNGYNSNCNDPSYCQPQCSYKWVTTYECRQVPYTVCVTKYDHCGRPYTAHVTQYKTIQVPVQKLVKYCPQDYQGQFAGNFGPGSMFQQ